ncbi:Testis-specific Y-encoded-like protein 5 [Cytospora mali]|uniref:Testis-specific Y-encoded-like protein 5 n=1 Tax=Cytospora mali TaxID=578113 RepID=A0A194VTU3_CYTMA|nr:Testis-specific Y-encoded-like protein 5 [Valsa mali]
MCSAAEEFTIEPQTIKELQLLEAALGDVDTEITAKQYLMAKDILAARQSTIAKIPKFWAVVFDHASSELEAAITSSDLEVFMAALQRMEVLRPEVPASATVSDVGLDKFGEPRSVTIRFHFGENAWFTDSVLEKTFYYRYGKDGSAGLVSEPVRINWKDRKDLTEGLTDAAYTFWAAQKQDPAQNLDGVITGEARKARDAAARQMPEYKALAQKLEESTNGAISFFNFFSYRGRWTSAAESVEAKAELLAKKQAALNGQSPADDDDDDEDEDFPEEDVETFPAGHEVAVSIAEDIFPSAIDYFMADTIDSDDELDGIEVDDSEDDDDVEMS